MQESGKILGIRTIAMPENTNSQGAIFGGWLMSQLDLAGAIAARQIIPLETNVVTVSVTDLVFKKPIYAGDIISCFAEVMKIGNTSLKINITVDVTRKDSHINEENVAGGIFTYVCVKNGLPHKVK